jgi:hypothetical protein
MIKSEVSITVSDTVNTWLRGESEYPGDSAIVVAMNGYITEHVCQRHFGNDVLAIAELDKAQILIDAICKHFCL